MKQRSDEDMKWSVVSSEQLIDRPWMKARRDTVQLPNGRVYDEYYVLSYPTWINVIAETEDGELILERQYRHGLGAPNPGIMNNLCHCFYARGVKKTNKQHLDETEDIEVFLCPKKEVKDMLLRGEFIQALMVAPLWKYFFLKD